MFYHSLFHTITQQEHAQIFRDGKMRCSLSVLAGRAAALLLTGTLAFSGNLNVYAAGNSKTKTTTATAAADSNTKTGKSSSKATTKDSSGSSAGSSKGTEKSSTKNSTKDAATSSKKGSSSGSKKTGTGSSSKKSASNSNSSNTSFSNSSGSRTGSSKSTSSGTTAAKTSQTAVPSATQVNTSVAALTLADDATADTVQQGLFGVINTDRTQIIDYSGVAATETGIRYLSMAGGQERASVWNIAYQLPAGTKADGTQTMAVNMTLKDIMAGRTLRDGESLQAYYDPGNGIYYRVPMATAGGAVSMTLPILTAGDQQYLIVVIVSGSWRAGSGYDYLAIGNSITMHPRQSYWPDAMGMGATKPQNDYYHIVSSYLNATANYMGKSYNSAALNYAIWEISYGTRSNVLYILDPYLSEDLELVTIQLGENAIPDAAGFAADLPKLIEYIQKKAPNAQIILVGNFWNDAVETTAKLQCAAAYGLAYADLSAISVDPYVTDTSSPYVFGNELAYDANGVGHTCEKDAVKLHPNNAGMQAIAASVLKAMGH